MPDVGDPVEVTNLNGETATGVVHEVLDITVDQRGAPFMRVDDATLYSYWRGADVDRGDPVVQVKLDGAVYDYPVSRVEVLDDA